MTELSLPWYHFLMWRKGHPRAAAEMAAQQVYNLIGYKNFSTIYEKNYPMEQSNATINQFQIEQQAIQAGL